MPLRCLVVDCGGVTHPDSGLKEAAGVGVGLQDKVLKHSKGWKPVLPSGYD